jgi:hypothetical protein
MQCGADLFGPVVARLNFLYVHKTTEPKTGCLLLKLPSLGNIGRRVADEQVVRKFGWIQSFGAPRYGVPKKAADVLNLVGFGEVTDQKEYTATDVVSPGAGDDCRLLQPWGDEETITHFRNQKRFDSSSDVHGPEFIGQVEGWNAASDRSPKNVAGRGTHRKRARRFAVRIALGKQKIVPVRLGTFPRQLNATEGRLQPNKVH